jgi:glycerophosphoryl diester phosphodiesterase
LSDWTSPHPTWIVGHRGAPKRARENTLDAMDFAETLGVDAIEFDLRQTRDGEAVLFHDDDIVLGTQRIPVRTFTAREIEKLQLPSEFGPYRVPKLEDVFHRYGRKMRYVVEVKTSAQTSLGLMARRVVRVAAEFGVRDRCIVASFDPELLRKIREIDAEIATGFLIDHAVAMPEPGKLTPLFPPVDAIGPRFDLVTPAFVAQAAAARLSVHSWTVDDPAEIRRLLSLGVASITTNVPEIALAIRAEDGDSPTSPAVPLFSRLARRASAESPEGEETIG